jgi:hypothetical protein
MKRATLAAAVILFAGNCAAATVSECIADVQLVKNDVLAATTFVNAVDQNGLAGKADGAMTKLDKGKFGDAASVLADMASKVNTLLTAAKPKLGAADAAVIAADIATSQTCVNQLMTQ